MRLYFNKQVFAFFIFSYFVLMPQGLAQDSTATAPASFTLNIWSASWCPPCQALHRMLEQQGFLQNGIPITVGRQRALVRVVIHDVDREREAARNARAVAMPTLVLSSGTAGVGRFTGYNNQQALTNQLRLMIAAYLGTSSSISGGAVARVQRMPSHCESAIAQARVASGSTVEEVKELAMEHIELLVNQTKNPGHGQSVLFGASIKRYLEQSVEGDVHMSQEGLRRSWARIERTSRGEFYLVVGSNTNTASGSIMHSSGAADGASRVLAPLMPSLVPAECRGSLRADERRVQRIFIGNEEGVRNMIIAHKHEEELVREVVSIRDQRRRLERAMRVIQDYCDAHSEDEEHHSDSPASGHGSGATE